jgi:hypothetical protein
VSRAKAKLTGRLPVSSGTPPGWRG